MSRFIYEPGERLYRSDEMDDCPCGKEQKLKTETRCPLCRLRQGLPDQFMCRREGHKPTVTLTRAQGVAVTSYITTCSRCGQTFEISP